MRFGAHFWKIFSDLGSHWGPLGGPSGTLLADFWRFFSEVHFFAFLFVFGGPRRQRRGLPESSDSADSGHLFHHALLPLCGGAANFKAAASAADLQISSSLI